MYMGRIVQRYEKEKFPRDSEITVHAEMCCQLSECIEDSPKPKAEAVV